LPRTCASGAAGRTPDAVRVRCYSTGRVRSKRAERGPRRYLPGGWSAETLPVHAFVVEHPAGLCIFDTGQTARAARPGYHPRWHPYLRLAQFELEAEDELAPQLRADGLDPDDVRWVALSHLHTDHVGGVADFRGAHVLVARREWERAQGIAGRLRGYLPQRWPPGLLPQLVDFEGPSVGSFPASHDVAGDGTLLLVPLPGHTPGHSGLLVERRVLLAGDTETVPRDLAALLAHDPEAAELAARPLS
jgi:glyoxylase-like metal-dependent hydrolase (beta-lactamase superfamily II)